MTLRLSPEEKNLPIERMWWENDMAVTVHDLQEKLRLSVVYGMIL